MRDQHTSARLSLKCAIILGNYGPGFLDKDPKLSLIVLVQVLASPKYACLLKLTRPTKLPHVFTIGTFSTVVSCCTQGIFYI